MRESLHETMHAGMVATKALITNAELELERVRVQLRVAEAFIPPEARVEYSLELEEKLG